MSLSLTTQLSTLNLIFKAVAVGFIDWLGGAVIVIEVVKALSGI
jgi:hypothetical protein